MRSTKPLVVLAGTAALSLALITVAGPASAATLPTGQKITIIDALDDGGASEGPFFDVNPANAASTPVGTGSGAYTTGVDVLDNGLGYAIGYTMDGPTLWKADANTGTVSDPLPLTYAPFYDFDDGTLPDRCDAIDLNPNGQLLVACISRSGFNFGSVSSVDVTTGEMTLLTYMVADFYQEFTAIALNPITGELWAFGTYYTGEPATFVVKLDAEDPYFAATPTAYTALDVLGADFDRDGQLFVSTYIDGDVGQYGLGVLNPTTGVFASTEPFINAATDEYLSFVNAITVWGAKPALAATGTDRAGAMPIALGSALLLLAGAAFVATSRIRRRTA